MQVSAYRLPGMFDNLAKSDHFKPLTLIEILPNSGLVASSAIPRWLVRIIAPGIKYRIM